MEEYDHFCAVSKFLYGELEHASLLRYAFKINDLDFDYWEIKTQELLFRIALHLEDFDRVVFNNENGF